MRNCTSRYKRSVSLSALPSPQSTESETESETETDLCNKLRSFALQPSRLDKLLAEIPTEKTAPTTKEVPTSADDWDVHLSQLGPRTGHRMMQPDSPPATYPPSPSPIASAHNQPSPTLAALATTATTTATIITTTPDDGLKTFIKEVLRKQAELFESKLAQQQQQQQRPNTSMCMLQLPREIPASSWVSSTGWTRRQSKDQHLDEWSEIQVTYQDQRVFENGHCNAGYSVQTSDGVRRCRNKSGTR